MAFEEALDAFGQCWLERDGIPMSHGAHSWVGRGLYALQIGIWMRHFPREQFLVVQLEEMSTTEGLDAVIARVFAHIGLPNYKLKHKERHNSRGGVEMPEGVRERLSKLYAPFNRWLGELLGEEWYPEHTKWR